MRPLGRDERAAVISEDEKSGLTQKDFAARHQITCPSPKPHSGDADSSSRSRPGTRQQEEGRGGALRATAR